MAYRKATQLDPGYFDAYYNLGVVSVQAGNLPQALAAYETAVAIQPIQEINATSLLAKILQELRILRRAG